MPPPRDLIESAATGERDGRRLFQGVADYLGVRRVFSSIYLLSNGTPVGVS
jgi:hypothetical protein